MDTLIVYGSKHGCTEKCANLLKEKLDGNVHVVNLKDSNEIDLSKYDKVIIGGSIYVGKIQKEVSKFSSENLETLKEKQVGLFICGMQSEEAIEKELNENFPKELLKTAKAKGYFGGEFIIDKLGFMEKQIVKKVAKVNLDKSNILNDNIYKFAEGMNNI